MQHVKTYGFVIGICNISKRENQRKTLKLSFNSNRVVSSLKINLISRFHFFNTLFLYQFIHMYHPYKIPEQNVNK